SFSADDLEQHPVIVVTHEFYKGIRGHKARSFTRTGITLPRVVTFVDEKVNEVDIYDVELTQVSNVCRFVQDNDHGLTILKNAADALLKFCINREFGDRTLERLDHDDEIWTSAGRDLQWFTTEAAGQFMRSSAVKRPTLPIEEVFGFARCLVENRAFIARVLNGRRTTNLVGFEPTLPLVSGMVLLDATADIDGVSV